MEKRTKQKSKSFFQSDPSRRGRSVKINNILEIETRADKNSFYFDFGYFCSFFNKILGFYRKTDKIESPNNCLESDRGRRAGSVKINNSP